MRNYFQHQPGSPSDSEWQRHSVVIAAAVAAVAGQAAKVRQIHIVQAVQSAAWARQGRVAIQSSHGVFPFVGRFVPDRETKQ